MEGNYYNNLLRLLKDKKITAKKLCEDLNISQTILIRWHKNNTIPSIKTLLKLTQYFKCNIGYFLGDDFYTCSFIEVSDIIATSYDIFDYYIKANNLNAYKVCEKVNTSNVTISHWKKGLILPRTKTLYDIAQLLNIPLGVLVGCEKDDNKEYTEPIQKEATEPLKSANNSELSREERILLAYYRKLRNKDKDKVIDFVVGLL